MDLMSLEVLAELMNGVLHNSVKGLKVENVSIDSRRIGSRSIFFALQGSKTNGHIYLDQAFANGAIAAVVSRKWIDRIKLLNTYPLIILDDPLQALQEFAAWWRKKIRGSVIAITGSNGKTIVKDSLIQILSNVHSVSGSPGSYNSQLGVPLSVLRIPSNVDYAVMEAGISAPQEMDRLEKILSPDFGILTNIGMSHIAFFGSQYNLAFEKMKLFKNIPDSGWILLPDDIAIIDKLIKGLSCKILRPGSSSGELPLIKSNKLVKDGTVLTVLFPNGIVKEIMIKTPSLEITFDIYLSICAAYLIGVNADSISQTLNGYEPPHTHMEIWRSPSGTTLINDACSSDPISVHAALRSLKEISHEDSRKIFVFGGMKELGDLEQTEHSNIGEMAAQHSVDILVLHEKRNLDVTAEAFLRLVPDKCVLRFKNIEELSSKLQSVLTTGDSILFKGPRNAGIDRVAQEIIDVIAPNRLIVNLQAVSENVSRFRQRVGSKVKILGMVKALAYGSDIVRLSKELQLMGLDLLGVSTPDEGAQLRKAGIDIPILVMVCTPDEVNKIIKYNLTPVIYSFDLVTPLAEAACKNRKNIDVHLKVDTGMGRLGVMPEQLCDLIQQVSETKYLNIVGLMTHFASADDPSQDEFTRLQIERFEKSLNLLNNMGFSDIISHAAATSGTVRFPESHFGMVRIGLGLYGAYPSPEVARNIDLDLAVSLISRITEIRSFKKGHMIGYGGTYTVPMDDFRAGFVPIGYYDGLPWRLSNQGHVLVNGVLIPIIGRISMDSMVIDLSQVPDTEVGSDVLLYGNYGGYVRRPEDMASESETIVYELLIRLGPRVQRIFLRQ